MAWYPDAVKKNIPPPSNDPPITARVAILHVAATEASSLYDYFNGPSGGVESHFYVKYDGTVEQYRDTAYQADANMQANDFAISIESQGLANGTWTDAQLASIKKLLLWIHTTHSVPLVVCPTWDGSGVGYHTLFEDQWDMRHASCPGPNRITQFKTVLVPWMSGQEDDMFSDADRAKLDNTLDKADGNYIVKQFAWQNTTTAAQFAALTAAIDALAKAQGAETSNITAVVDKAVRDRLAQIGIVDTGATPPAA